MTKKNQEIVDTYTGEAIPAEVDLVEDFGGSLSVKSNIKTPMSVMSLATYERMKSAAAATRG